MQKTAARDGALKLNFYSWYLVGIPRKIRTVLREAVRWMKSRKKGMKENAQRDFSHDNDSTPSEIQYLFF